MSLTLTDAGLQPGVYDHITNEAYHADPAVGSTTLKNLLDPSKYGTYDERGQAPFKRSPALGFGTIAHEVLLEGDESRIALMPFDDYRTKAAREARDAAENAGQIPLKAAEYDQVMRVVEAVREHPVASDLLTGHIAEQTIVHRDPETGLLIKVRPDARTPGIITDLKTAADVDPRRFSREVIPTRGYQLSAALYVDVVREVLGEECEFFIIGVDKPTDPEVKPRVVVTRMGEAYLADGRARYRVALSRYAHGLATGEWPSTYTAEPPAWLGFETTDLIEGA